MNHSQRPHSEGGGEDKPKEDKEFKISPRLLRTSRRMTLYKEADRLTQYANTVFVSINNKIGTIGNFQQTS